MMKLIAILFVSIACVSASHVHLAAPAFVTAQSSQVIARNYNGIVTPAVLPVTPKVFNPFLPPRVFSPYVPSYHPYPHHYHPYVRPVYYY